MNKINLPNKKKVKDGLSLLEEAVNFTTSNNLKRVDIVKSSYAVSFHFICSRGKYLELEKYILSKYPGKFYRVSDDPYYSTKDIIPDYVDSLFLYIRNDIIRNQRVYLHHFYKEEENFERLEIKVSTWISFMKSNLFEDEIIGLFNKLSYEEKIG